MRNLHIALPENLYRELRTEARRSRRPARTLAREAIELWLRDRRGVARHEAIAAFAAEYAGTPLDFNSDLETASIKHLLGSEQER